MKVGEFVNDNFVSTWQKVGTFTIVNGQKLGGNVACYFCRADGTVLHAVAGPVKPDELLAEARFAVELDKLAQLDGGRSADKQRKVVADAHLKRVKQEARGWADPPGLDLPKGRDSFYVHFAQLKPQAQVSALLTKKALAPLEDFYPLVWEKILRQTQNAAPVVVR